MNEPMLPKLGPKLSTKYCFALEPELKTEMDFMRTKGFDVAEMLRQYLRSRIEELRKQVGAN